MKDKEKTETEEFVENITGQCERLASVAMLAQFYRERYLAFIEAGFTPHETLEIIKARGINVKQDKPKYATGMYLTKHGKNAKPIKSWNIYRDSDGTEYFKELFGKGYFVKQEDVENDIREQL